MNARKTILTCGLMLCLIPSSQIASRGANALPKRAVCAVCHVREKSGPEPVAASIEHKGRTYYFCQEDCRTEFLKDPEHWIREGEKLKPVEGGTAPS